MASGYRVKEFGGPEVMIWEPLNLGELAPDAVRVRVGASGINFAETRMRAGDYSGQELPFVMGMEVAGSVEQVGREVAGFKVGCLLYTSPSPRDKRQSRMPSSA